jgi:hypothetical protein
MEVSMRNLSYTLFVYLIPFVVQSLQATTIHVPGDSTTIQSGINGADHGDTVLVAPGTYVENIDFLGKAILVLGDKGPDSTIIDGNQMGSVVSFITEEDNNSIIEGFTITNGTGTYVDIYWDYCGGGIYCDGSSPTIQYNRITGNSANNGGGIVSGFASASVIRFNTIYENSAVPQPSHIGGGGGIAVAFDSYPEISNNDIYDNLSGVAGGGMACGFYSNPVVRNNTIHNNVANVYGGGIQIYDHTTGIFENNVIMENTSLGENGAGGISCRLGSSPWIANNLIIDNSAATYGGGIRCFDEAVPTIMNNLIVGNEAGISGGGIESDDGASATVTNTIIWNNQAPDSTELWVGQRFGASAELTISYSDVDGGTASVYVDPGSILNWGDGMIDANPLFADPDYHLQLLSPCVDSGDPSILDACRPPGRGGERSDMGAYGGEGNCGWPVESVDLVIDPMGPVSVPKGDTLYFSTLIQNNTAFPIAGDYWLSVMLPNMNEIEIPENFLNFPNPLSGQVPAGGSLDLSNELYVPLRVGTGSYQLKGRVGIHPNLTIDEWWLDFEVIE